MVNGGIDGRLEGTVALKQRRLDAVALALRSWQRPIACPVADGCPDGVEAAGIDGRAGADAGIGVAAALGFRQLLDFGHQIVPPRGRQVADGLSLLDVGRVPAGVLPVEQVDDAFSGRDLRVKAAGAVGIGRRVRVPLQR